MNRMLIAAALAAGLLAGCAGPRDPWGGDYALHYRPASGEGQALDLNDRVYLDQDGDYYCQRADGTLGLVTMAGGGGLPPNLVTPGRSRKLGSVVAQPGGGAIRDAIERRVLRCV
ncbi:hypothetical protein [Sphingosinicella sp. CPCC 101087]|uniref:hypothetical protein n=1 Tax=Sphingosinicella sp. CPCC 101087 TaxID=2497754 RepID=UPI00101CE0CA|nr:hypothetical protein [Sphingosinicella sp. CPCC 101087]